MAVVTGGAFLYPGRGVAAVAHQGHDLPVFLHSERRLNRAPAHDGQAGPPGFAVVVGDGHQRHVKAVGVQGQQDAAAGQ